MPVEDLRSRWEVEAGIGAMRVDRDFAGNSNARWTPIVGGRAGYAPSPLFAVFGEGWVATFEPGVGEERVMWGGGAHLRFIPWGDRGWPLDPTFNFGVETIQADDDEDRSVAFAAGVGLSRGIGDRGRVRVVLRNHFLTVDEPAIGGVDTGRDVSLWEIGLVLGYRPGRVR